MRQRGWPNFIKSNHCFEKNLHLKFLFVFKQFPLSYKKPIWFEEINEKRYQ